MVPAEGVLAAPHGPAIPPLHTVSRAMKRSPGRGANE